MFKKIFLKATIIQTISYYLADFARSMGYKGRVEVIPNGVNNKHFSQNYSENDLRILKNNLQKKEGDVFLVTTSRLAVKNAVDDVIKSLQFLPSNVKFLIIGSGHEEKKLRELVRKLNLQDRVKFLGFIGHKDIPKYLKISDIFIRPSLSEGMGNSFIEAMATGISVIATPVGGIVDFLKDGETGLFCKVKDPASIAEQVKRLVGNRDLRDKLVNNAQKMVTEKYDWNQIAKDMKERVFKS